MLIAGFQKLTLLDYPGKIAALIFTQGCNFACGYCHNPEMIPLLRILPERPELEPAWILNFLETRKGLLDGVVISGGEPTLQKDLVDMMRAIKSLGFLIKLDSNGSNPEILAQLLKDRLVDYMAMDIKHAPKKYRSLIKNDSQEKIKQSVQLIMDLAPDYEFRSTLLPLYHEKEDIVAMGELIAGAKQWYLQSFRPLKTLDRKLQRQRSFNTEEIASLTKLAKKYVKKVGVRT